MSTNWHQFLVSQGYSQNDCNDYLIDNHGKNDLFELFPITKFGFIKVSGQDAKTLLQGQATCNIEDVNEHQSSFGAFCNPKGRTFTTFIICQHNDNYFLLLPHQLIGSIVNRLKLFILRSKVMVDDVSDEFIQIGLTSRSTSNKPFPFFPIQDWNVKFEKDFMTIKVPSANSRFLIISAANDAQKVWAKLQNILPAKARSSVYWQQQDIFDGIPWTSSETTELFIPQAMNVENLDGISYTKGCYTGQEIVARTHYLGKIKRKLTHGELISGTDPKPGESIHYANNNKTSAGTILNVVRVQNRCFLSMVLIDEVVNKSVQQFETAGGSTISIK
ncbi:MAG: hypothetical protein V3U75_03695 [Methylococcaceae bacterium]